MFSTMANQLNGIETSTKTTMPPNAQRSSTASSLLSSSSSSSSQAAAPETSSLDTAIKRAVSSADRLLQKLGPPSGNVAPAPNAKFDIIQEGSVRGKKTSSDSPEKKASVRVAIANIKYKNDAGRAAVLAACTAIHHDFGDLTSIINVTLDVEDLEALSKDENIAWVDRDGAVYFVQPWKY